MQKNLRYYENDLPMLLIVTAFCSQMKRQNKIK